MGGMAKRSAAMLPQKRAGTQLHRAWACLPQPLNSSMTEHESAHTQVVAPQVCHCPVSSDFG